MKTSALTIFLLLTTVVITLAQYNYTAIPLMDYFRVEQMTEETLTVTLTQDNIQGSPYLEDEFITGTVFTTSKKKIENVLLRYNIYNDDLEFKTPNNKILAIDNPKSIELADFGDYQMVYQKYLSGKKIHSAFFKILEEGNATLFAKPDVYFQKEVKGDGIKADKPAKFVQKSDIFYITIGDAPAKKMVNKKDLIAVFENHSKEVSAYIKKNKIKVSKSKQLQQLVKYYNSL